MKIHKIQLECKELSFIIFLILCVLYYLHGAVEGGLSFPGDLGDTRLNQIILEHLFKWISGQESDLWSLKFFWPYTGSLAFSDNHFGSMVFYAVWRFVGFFREASFNLWFCTGVILTLIACFVVLYRIGLSAAGAAAGAFIFTLSLPMLAHEGHSQLIYRFPIPLAIFSLLKYFDSKKIEWIAQVATYTALQFLCSIYLGVFLSYLLVAISIAYSFMRNGTSLEQKPVFCIEALKNKENIQYKNY